MPPALRAQLDPLTHGSRRELRICRPASRARPASLLKTAKAQDHIQYISEYADLSS